MSEYNLGGGGEGEGGGASGGGQREGGGRRAMTPRRWVTKWWGGARDKTRGGAVRKGTWGPHPSIIAL
eukprot:scaffold7641_cov67-Phaeocystis_antarctica.AAC.2